MESMYGAIMKLEDDDWHKGIDTSEFPKMYLQKYNACKVE